MACRTILSPISPISRHRFVSDSHQEDDLLTNAHFEKFKSIDESNGRESSWKEFDLLIKNFRSQGEDAKRRELAGEILHLVRGALHFFAGHRWMIPVITSIVSDKQHVVPKNLFDKLLSFSRPEGVADDVALALKEAIGQ